MAEEYKQEISGEWSCPHCGERWIPDDIEASYHDDYADGTSMLCEDCGGEYQLRCVSVNMHFETRIADAKPNITNIIGRYH